MLRLLTFPSGGGRTSSAESGSRCWSRTGETSRSWFLSKVLLPGEEEEEEEEEEEGGGRHGTDGLLRLLLLPADKQRNL